MTKRYSDKGVKKKSGANYVIIIGIVVAIAAIGGIAVYFTSFSEAGDAPDNLLVGRWYDIHGVGVYNETLYLATHNGLFKKTSSGWEVVGNDRSDLMGFVISPIRDGVMYSSGHPPTGGNLGFRKSMDGGETWQTISPVTSPIPVDFHAMDASAVDENLVYGSPGGSSDIYVTYDEGKTWERRSAPSQVISLAADPKDADVVYAGTSHGLFVSSNQGNSWQKVDAELLEGIVTGLGFSGNVLYAYVIPGQGEGYITKSSDGQTWSKTEGQIPGVRGGWKFSEGSDGEVYTIVLQNTAFGGAASSVYKSVDGGNSWVLEGTNNKSIVDG